MTLGLLQHRGLGSADLLHDRIQRGILLGDQIELHLRQSLPCRDLVIQRRGIRHRGICRDELGIALDDTHCLLHLHLVSEGQLADHPLSTLVHRGKSLLWGLRLSFELGSEGKHRHQKRSEIRAKGNVADRGVHELVREPFSFAAQVSGWESHMGSERPSGELPDTDP